ncbi:hypothetical protein DQ04_06671020 [Trypanosoma grayi]|uniref:hypothetical protein n=1 Tax=Trypanosoma grayi TaxID=71804 RepID=UPI0004F437D9|nr:hypothetical protein DQ04_06671020 [Trypanosoma grayi]KEG08672.1 hypothetical protein DQ04_06671020 [Trypanosoma grayi]
MLHVTRRVWSCYVPVVGGAFLLDTLYGSKYSPHIGVCNLPYVYVKTVLFCTSQSGSQERERNYVLGLIDHLIPFTALRDEQTKLELVQFVDAMTSRPNPGSTSANMMVTSGAERQRRNEPATVGELTSQVHSTTRGSNSSSPPQVSENVASFLSGALLPTALARVLLYDAMCVCVADGEYDDAERDRVSHVAAKLGIPHHVREAIEKVVVQEHQLAVRKRQFLLLSDVPPPR